MRNPIKLSEQNQLVSAKEKILVDRIFIRDQHKLIKLYLDEILYLEASRNYCKVVTFTSEYLVSIPMKAVEQKINSKKLFKIHRSFVINLEKIDEILYENHVRIGKKEIPISRSYYDAFLKLIPLI